MCTVHQSEKNDVEWFFKCLKKEWEDYDISKVLKKTLYMLNEKIKDINTYETQSSDDYKWDDYKDSIIQYLNSEINKSERKVLKTEKLTQTERLLKE